MLKDQSIEYVTESIKEITIKARRIDSGRDVYNTPIACPADAAKAARLLIEGEDCERFVVIPLDIRNKPLGVHLAASGGIDSCAVDSRLVFRAAILLGASAIIVAHNHPSGDLSPSTEDITLTEKLIKCGKVLGVPIHDHLILTETSHLSLREQQGSMWNN